MISQINGKKHLLCVVYWVGFLPCSYNPFTFSRASSYLCFRRDIQKSTYIWVHYLSPHIVIFGIWLSHLLHFNFHCSHEITISKMNQSSLFSSQNHQHFCFVLTLGKHLLGGYYQFNILYMWINFAPEWINFASEWNSERSSSNISIKFKFLQDANLHWEFMHACRFFVKTHES